MPTHLRGDIAELVCQLSTGGEDGCTLRRLMQDVNDLAACSAVLLEQAGDSFTT